MTSIEVAAVLVVVGFFLTALFSGAETGPTRSTEPAIASAWPRARRAPRWSTA